MTDQSTAERRMSPRYQVTLPIEVGPVRGVTNNISTGGVVFVSNAPFTVGACVDFLIRFSEGVSRMPVVLECTGVVVRHRELPDGSFETALTMGTMRADAVIEFTPQHVDSP